MTSRRRSATRGRWVASIVLLAAPAGLVACGDDDGEPASSPAGSGPTTAAADATTAGGGTAVTSASPGSTSPGSASANETLAGALLTAEEVDSGWTTDGPEPLQMQDAIGRCPEGAPFAIPDEAVFVRFQPPAPSSDFIDQGVLTFGEPSDLDAWFTALESCVGTTWEEGSDPVEHVSVESIEVADHGDERAGFVLQFAHAADEDPAHATRWFLVQIGDALLVVSGDDEDLADEAGEAFLAEVVARAVAKAEAALPT